MRFGTSMRFAFAEEADEAKRRGWASLVWFWCRSVAQLVLLALAERLPAKSALAGWRSGILVSPTHAARRLRRSPGFTATAGLTLTLGIGATTAIFTLIQGVVLDPLPYPNSDRLVAVQHRAEGIRIPLMGVSLGTYVHYREHNRAFEEFTAFTPTTFAVLGDEGALRVPGARVTQGFFEIFLDGPPPLGRVLTDSDQEVGAPPVAVIGFELWQSHFGRSPSIIGRTISLDGSPVEVIGVLPPEFDVPTNRSQLWVPERLDPERVILGFFGRIGVARLKPNTSPEQAQSELQRLIPSLADRFNPLAFELIVTGGRLTSRIIPLKESVVGDIRQTLWILMGTVLFVLGIAFANVANLFLVRVEAQRGEVAVRRALGAGRAHIVRHHLSETLLLSSLGALGGLVMASLALDWVIAWGQPVIPRLHNVALGLEEIGVTAIVTLLTGLLLGAIPLLRTPRQGATATLSERSRANTVSRSRHRVRNSLVVVQLSLALILLVGSGLMVRTFMYLRGVEPGLDASSSLVFQIGLPPALYPDRDGAFRFQQQILERLRAVPGVVEAGATVCLPLDPCDGRTPVYAHDDPIEEGEVPPSVDVRGATSGLFSALGVPVVEGRAFNPSDPYRDPAAAIVTRNVAERLWPGERAIGKQIHADYPGEEPFTIVGVVSDIRAHGPTQPSTEILWVSFLGPYAYMAPTHTLTFVLKTAVPPLSLTSAVRGAVRELDSHVPIANMSTMESLADRANAPTVFAMILLVSASLVALILGTVGVYGVLSYVVSLRTNEIGLRMALGAEAGSVSRMVLRQAVRVIAAGILLGILGAITLTRWMGAVLYGVSPLDPGTFLSVAMGLTVTAILASYLPARRAAAVDPVEALRTS